MLTSLMIGILALGGMQAVQKRNSNTIYTYNYKFNVYDFCDYESLDKIWYEYTENNQRRIAFLTWENDTYVNIQIESQYKISFEEMDFMLEGGEIVNETYVQNPYYQEEGYYNLVYSNTEHFIIEPRTRNMHEVNIETYVDLEGYYTFIETNPTNKAYLKCNRNQINSTMTFINLDLNTNETQYLKIQDEGDMYVWIYDNKLIYENINEQIDEQYTNLVYISGVRLFKEDMQNIKIFELENPDLFNSQFVNEDVYFQGAYNPYYKWGKSLKENLWIPLTTQEQAQTSNYIYNHIANGLFKISSFNCNSIVDLLKKADDTIQYWQDDNYNNPQNWRRYPARTNVDKIFVTLYGNFEYSNTGLRQGSTTYDDWTPQIANLDYVVKEYVIDNEDTIMGGNVRNTRQLINKITIKVLSNNTPLWQFKEQFTEIYTLPSNYNDNYQNIFELLANGFESWGKIFNLQLGTIKIGTLMFAPLLVGFLVWLIHLVKRG